jgi:hypothetical protein
MKTVNIVYGTFSSDEFGRREWETYAFDNLDIAESWAERAEAFWQEHIGLRQAYLDEEGSYEENKRLRKELFSLVNHWDKTSESLNCFIKYGFVHYTIREIRLIVPRPKHASKQYIRKFMALNCAEDIIAIYKAAYGLDPTYPTPSISEYNIFISRFNAELQIAFGMVAQVRPLALQLAKKGKVLHLVSWDENHLATVICAFLFKNVRITCLFDAYSDTSVRNVIKKMVNRSSVQDAKMFSGNALDIEVKPEETTLFIATHPMEFQLHEIMARITNNIDGAIILPNKFTPKCSFPISGACVPQEIDEATSLLGFMHQAFLKTETGSRWNPFLSKDHSIGHPRNVFASVIRLGKDLTF